MDVCPIELTETGNPSKSWITGELDLTSTPLPPPPLDQNGYHVLGDD